MTIHSRKSDSRDRRRRGFTLAELAVAITVMGMVTLGLASAIRISTHALPEAGRPAYKTIQAAQVMGDIAEDLRVAVNITERSLNSITFTVADRDADGSPETIRYAWSGTAGDPLTRQLNHGVETTVLDDVAVFDMGYYTRSATETYPGPLIESAESELAGYEGASNLGDAHVHNDGWWSQYFTPTFPAEAINWRVTRVQFRARDDSDALPTTIELRLPEANTAPSNTIIESVDMQSTELTSSYLWVEKTFSQQHALTPGNGLCLVFMNTIGSTCKLEYQNKNVVFAGASLTEAKSAVWQTPATDAALQFHAWGTYLAQGPDQSAKRDYVTNVQIGLQVGGDASSRLDTSVMTLNLPEALSHIWELDFDTDPTTLDMNGDGQADWVESAGVFKVALLKSGVWTSDGSVVLAVSPDTPLTELTTVELTLRDTAIDGAGVEFRTEFDQTGGLMAQVVATLTLGLDGSQTLALAHYTDAGTSVKLAGYTRLPSDLINLRLILDPAADTVAAFIDGAHKGTYAYATYGGSTTNTAIRGVNAPGEFGFVSVRVGGNYP